MTRYDYEYYSISQKWLNTNTNIIQLPRHDQIRILLGFPIMTEYKQYLASQKWSNSINEYKFCWGSQKEGLHSKTSSESHKVMLNSLSPLMTEANYKCKLLPIHMTQWLTWCDSGKWGWITVLAHKVVLAAPSTQGRPHTAREGTLAPGLKLNLPATLFYKKFILTNRSRVNDPLF